MIIRSDILHQGAMIVPSVHGINHEYPLYMHPYSIYAMYITLHDEIDVDMDTVDSMAVQDGTFLIDDFMNDLGRLYTRLPDELLSE